MKKILMPIMESGSGHKMPAQAVKDALETLYPGKYRIDVIDFARQAGAHKADKTIKRGWDFILAHPFFGKTGYILLELLHFLPERFINLQLRDFKKKGGALIKKIDPDLIFSPHFFCSAVSAMAKIKYGLKTKVVVYVTDPFDAYVWWAIKNTDAILAASELARSRLIKNGVAEARIKVFPFPINKNFSVIGRKKQEIFKDYDLDPAKKTILASSGGQGIGKTAGYIKSILKADLPFNIILVCGKNEKLQRRMLELKRTSGRAVNLVVLGYVNNMNELHLIADLVMGKAGASATFEAIHMLKPIIFTEWACYNEKPNIDFCIRKGFGFNAADEKSLLRILKRILSTSCLEACKNRLKQFNFQSGAVPIAGFIDSLC